MNEFAEEILKKAEKEVLSGKCNDNMSNATLEQ